MVDEKYMWNGLPVMIKKHGKLFNIYEPYFKLGAMNVKSISEGFKDLDRMFCDLFREYVLCDIECLTEGGKKERNNIIEFIMTLRVVEIK